MTEKQKAMIDPQALMFVKFLDLVRAATTNASGANLSDQEIKVLHKLALRWQDDDVPLSVINAIRTNAHSSPATISKILHQLRHKGYIDFVLNQDDSRIKHIFPASEAFKYLKVMGQCLLKARD